MAPSAGVGRGAPRGLSAPRRASGAGALGAGSSSARARAGDRARDCGSSEIRVVLALGIGNVPDQVRARSARLRIAHLRAAWSRLTPLAAVGFSPGKQTTAHHPPDGTRWTTPKRRTPRPTPERNATGQSPRSSPPPTAPQPPPRQPAPARPHRADRRRRLHADGARRRGGQVVARPRPERPAVDHRHGHRAAVVVEVDQRSAGQRLVGDAQQRAAHPLATGGPAPVEAWAVPGDLGAAVERDRPALDRTGTVALAVRVAVIACVARIARTVVLPALSTCQTAS